MAHDGGRYTPLPVAVDLNQAWTADAQQPMLAGMIPGPVPKQDTAHVDQKTPVATGNHHNDAFDCDYTYAQPTDGIAAWQEQSSLQMWFMLSGIITLMLNILSLVLNVFFGETLFGIIVPCVVVWVFLASGLVGLTLVVHKGLQHVDLRNKVKALRILAYSTCVFTSIIAVLWLIAGILESIEENLLAIKMFFLGFWHVYHAALSLTVAFKAKHVKHLLDPVSSGVLDL